MNGTINNNNNFNYFESSIPNINTIDPSEASPVAKGIITITGTDFGTDENNIEVHLLKKDSDNEIAYNLFLLEVTN